ncbi:DUF1003 domain-containing protein [Dawidia soli]|uniref:DUF1003 domain-containing protein n=1 Tax=Dawidia soli TaxID=2782352 RepID=A0AAP2GIE4_9BACT|nr:DUF1003 domain-containing protein [Dawidia soli]MBT1688221.1 DUF1003 domain-containing protein [Dawidia soli]
MKKVHCHLSNREIPASQAIKGTDVRPGIRALIKQDHPTFTDDAYVSLDELLHYRKRYLENMLKDEVGELSHLEQAVLNSINQDELLSTNIEPRMEKEASLGDRIADRIAEFGGSWTFIILFFLFIALWMCTNIFILLTRPFDPYPFILLNLILSCLAAIQAPIIMMSQNRQEAKDRQRSEHDYKINLKAELEIRLLHEKIDHLILQQNQRLLEIQQIQVDLMDDILDKLNHRAGGDKN